MKKKTICSIMFCLSFMTWTIAQSPGFFGRKNIIDVQAHGNVPLIDGIFNLVFGGINEEPFKEKSNKLIQKRDWFNYGFSIQNFHYFKKSTGIGIQLSYDFQNTSGPYSVSEFDASGYSYSFSIDHEMLKINTLTIMPKLEFGSYGSILPAGLSHQLGIGFTITSIVKKNYLAVYDDFYTPIDTTHRTILNNLFEKKNYKGITLLYQMNYRTPLNKRLFLNWGVRYNLNLCALGVSDEYNPITGGINPNYNESEQEIKRAIRMTRLTNSIQFTLGLGFTY